MPAAWALRAVLTLDADGQHDTRGSGSCSPPGRAILGAWSWGTQLRPGADAAPQPHRQSHLDVFISLFAGRRHSDTQTGFRVYPQRLFRLPLRTRRFDTETELCCAAKLGVPLHEVPITTIYSVPPTESAAAAPQPNAGRRPAGQPAYALPATGRIRCASSAWWSARRGGEPVGCARLTMPISLPRPDL